MIASQDHAFALSSGCSLVNGKNLTLNGGGTVVTGADFAAGETIFATSTKISGFNDGLQLSFTPGDSLQSNNESATQSFVFKINADVTGGTLSFNTIGGSVFQATFGCSDNANAATAGTTAVAQSLMQIGITQNNGLVANQIRKFTGQTSPNVRSNLASAPGLLDLSAGRTGEAAGGSAKTKVSVFADVTWTNFDDSAPTTGSRGDSFTGIIGGDYAVTDRFLVGGALSFERHLIDTSFNLGEVSATGVGVSPYAAYRLDDVFSLTALANVTSMSGSTNRTGGAVAGGPNINGDFDGLRWSVYTSGEGFWTWNSGASLLASLGVSYGQQSIFSYTEDDGTFVDNNLSRSGVVSAAIQPGLLLAADDDLFLEPYFRLQYDYQFVRTKFAGGNTEDTRHPNEPHQLVIGLGMNVFSGEQFSANIEGSAVAFREQYSAYTLGARARYTF